MSGPRSYKSSFMRDKEKGVSSKAVRGEAQGQTTHHCSAWRSCCMCPSRLMWLVCFKSEHEASKILPSRIYVPTRCHRGCWRVQGHHEITGISAASCWLWIWPSKPPTEATMYLLCCNWTGQSCAVHRTEVAWDGHRIPTRRSHSCLGGANARWCWHRQMACTASHSCSIPKRSLLIPISFSFMVDGCVCVYVSLSLFAPSRSLSLLSSLSSLLSACFCLAPSATSQCTSQREQAMAEKKHLLQCLSCNERY